MGEDSLLLQLGVGGIFAFIIIKEVLTLVLKFLAKKKNGQNEAIPPLSQYAMSDLFTLLRDTKAEIDELFDDDWKLVEDDS